MSERYTINADDPLLKIDDVMKRVQISQAEIYRRMAAGDFPRPLKLGHRTVRWPASWVSAWVQSLPLPAPTTRTPPPPEPSNTTDQPSPAPRHAQTVDKGRGSTRPRPAVDPRRGRATSGRQRDA